MTALVDSAIAAAGLSGVLASRQAGDLEAVRAWTETLRAADLLVLGALADRVRAEEVGNEVRVFADVTPDEGDDVVLMAPRASGLEFLREVAVARITGPKAARLRIDWTACGLELAQVALGFGANELVGEITTKRGLPIAEGDLSGVGKRSSLEPMKVAKQRELAGFIERGGRRPVFVGQPAGQEA